jgi:hypothetical protein
LNIQTDRHTFAFIYIEEEEDSCDNSCKLMAGSYSILHEVILLDSLHFSYVFKHVTLSESSCLNKPYLRFQVLTAASMKFRVLWDVAPCSQDDVDRRLCVIALMMVAGRTSESSVNINLITGRYIPEDSKLQTISR